jgi:hypothetical protein
VAALMCKVLAFPPRSLGWSRDHSGLSPTP